MNGNPWQVDSIEAFIFLKCPECTLFFTKDEDIFQLHANEYHPLSVVFFGKALDELTDGKEVFGKLEPRQCLRLLCNFLRTSGKCPGFTGL